MQATKKCIVFYVCLSLNFIIIAHKLLVYNQTSHVAYHWAILSCVHLHYLEPHACRIFCVGCVKLCNVHPMSYKCHGGGGADVQVDVALRISQNRVRICMAFRHHVQWFSTFSNMGNPYAYLQAVVEPKVSPGHKNRNLPHYVFYYTSKQLLYYTLLLDKMH